jgi:soluble lytic murein transglycosylase-like protein
MNSILTTISLAAQLSGAPVEALTAICFQESSLEANIVVKNDGSSSSYGLCQVKLGTAQDVLKGVGSANLLDPFLNAFIAGKYLRKLLKRYNGNLDCAVNAYNTGARKTKCNSQTRYTKYVTAVRKHMRRTPWVK